MHDTLRRHACILPGLLSLIISAATATAQLPQNISFDTPGEYPLKLKKDEKVVFASGDLNGDNKADLVVVSGSRDTPGAGPGVAEQR